MNVEMSVSNATAKRRALHALREHGYRATSGPIRLAYPFAVLVEDVSGLDAVAGIVRSADPLAGVIATAPPSPMAATV